MVLTRKRSCSASESATAATGTTRAAKLIKKQDDGVGSPASKTTTPSCSTPTTRRTRRVTDSLVDAAPSSPRPTRTTRSSNDSTTQGTRTPVKTSSDGSHDSQGGKQLRVTLRDIATPSTPITRSRRTSGVGAGDLDAAVKSVSLDSADVAGTPTTTSTTVSTPVRRSRRLSGDGVDLAGQGTPNQLSFSIARIIGSEGRKTKEEAASKQSSLPVIKEDKEANSPKKNEKPHAAEEGKINTEKPEQTLQPGCGGEVKELDVSSAESGARDLPVTAEDKESSSPAPSSKEAESNGELVDEQTVDSSICDGKLSTTRSITEDTDGGKKEDVVEGTKSNDGDEEQMTASSDGSVEGMSKNLNDAKEEEQNNAISTSDSMEVTTSPIKPASPKDKHKTAPKEDVTKELPTTQDTQVTSSAPVDENGNKNLNGVSPVLSEIKAGDKKLLKVIPELEKKIEQLRSVPKGQPISGKWWKKEKQRFRSIKKDASGKKKWSQKMHLKQWRGDVMARSAAIEAEKQQKKEDLKERQRINKIRREENAKKAEIVQVIKDPRKIKKMKRKQLRYIETRDTTNLTQG